jgi:tetratricopeptide (TPR) repeat protein
MAILYCRKCEKSVNTWRENKASGTDKCPICDVLLVYFGREASVLSPLDILAQYDDKHPYNPIGDFTGDYFTNTFNPAQDAMMIECEDTLMRHPNDLDASFHLSLCYLAKGQMDQALKYLIPVLEAKLDSLEPYKKAVIIYMQQNKPEKAYPILRQLSEKEPGSSYVWENLGKVCLSLKKSKKAFVAFKEAKKMCKDDKKKESLTKAMSQIKTYLDAVSR